MKRSLYRLGAILLLAASMAAGAMAQQSVLESPAVQQDLMTNGMTATIGGPQELAAKIKSEIPLMRDLIKSAGIVRP